MKKAAPKTGFRIRTRRFDFQNSNREFFDNTRVIVSML